ncbi:uncharacterized protein HGUI_02919 [Hanseniaspora guilliermondii]|uniref:Myosin motor domain-containing protein n=1 Tax=Hanseniaspora guilliermondii TaxID=56406 RepID=A0A1L0D0R3_9ASCO|nr:uncharacterized protein HGUI_02919 [Hanseniaspora guilliermondii]
MTIDQNTHNQEYWVEDSIDLFTKAKLLKTLGKNNKYEVELISNGSKRIVDKILSTNASYFDDVDNLSELPNLNEPSVLNNLNKRFEKGKIYTFSGLFLVAVNPYEHKPELYSDSVIQKYHNDKSITYSRSEFSNLVDGSLKDKNILDPHVFAISEEAMKNLFELKKDQSILVTGESGAGKTENTKKILQYLTNVTQLSSLHTKHTKIINFEDKILESNPILESFGNATTVKNNNSSRFGKFIKIFFDTKTKDISKTFIDWYLLEKSRVTFIDSANERNYHIFYQLLKGIQNNPTNEIFKDLHISAKETDFNHWNYLRTNKKDIQDIDDLQEFSHLINAFDKIGFTAKEQNEIFKIISAILHLGNVTFTKHNSKLNIMDKQATLTENDHKLLNIVADLLGIEDLKEFEISLTEPKVKAGREIVKQKKNCKQSKAIIDSLAKIIYEKLFGYIVSKINKSLDHNEDATQSESNLNFIGLLDIAGFEIFDKNSLEQLLINFTNENLQQFFNHHMFILEQEEYMKENISWNFKDYGLDLQNTIDLLSSKPNGILPILDEETIMPNSTDQKFYDRLIDTFQKNSRFQRVKASHNKDKKHQVDLKNFIVEHYAGSVEYDSADWLHKNKEPLNEQLHSLLKSSKNGLIRDELFAEDIRKSNSFKTQTQRHSSQLNSLLDNLRNANPHFIRCILPNRVKSSKVFDKKLVLDQLTCNGVLEGIRISREGFPNRIPFEAFVKDYQILLDDKFDNQNTDAKQLTRDIMNIIKDKINEKAQDFQIGKSKILFRAGKLAILEQLKQEKMAFIVTSLNSYFKGEKVRIGMKKEMEKIHSAKLLSNSFQFYDEILLNNGWFKVFAAVRPLLEADDDDSSESSKKRNKLSDILSKNEELVNMVNSLETKLTEVKQTSKKITDVNTKLEDDIIKTQNERSALINRIEVLEADLNERMDTKNKEIESIKQSSKDELSSLNSMKEELTEKEKSLSKQVDVLIEEKTELMKQIKFKDEELTAKSLTHEEHSKANEDLKSTINELKSEIKAKNASIQDLENKLKNHDKSIDTKLTALEDKFTSANDKVSLLVKENQETRAELSSIKLAKTKLESEVLEKTNALSKSEMNLKVLEREIKESEKNEQIKYVQEEEKYKTQISQLLGELDSLRNEMGSLKRSYEEKVEDLIKKQKEELHSAKSQDSVKVINSSSDLNSLKIRIQQLENDLYKEKLNTDFLHQKTLDVTTTKYSNEDGRALKAELLDIKTILIREQKEKSDAMARIKFLRTKLAGTNMDNEEMNIKIKKMISVLHENKISIESIGFNSNMISLDEKDQEYVNLKNQLNKSILEMDQLKEKLNQEISLRNKSEQQRDILISKMVDVIKPATSSTTLNTGYTSLDSSLNSNSTIAEYTHSGNSSATVLELKKQLVDLKDVLDSTSTNLLKAEQKIIQMQRNESRLNMKIISLEKDLEASSRQNQLYSQSLQEYKEEYQDISEQLLDLEAKCRQSDQKIIEQNEKLYQLGSIVEKSKNEHMHMNKELMIKEDRIVELEDTLSGKEVELEKMKQLNMLLNEDVEHMKSTLTDFSRDSELIGKIEFLNSKISKMSRSEIELNKQISNLEFDLEQLENEHELKLAELTRQNEHYLKQNNEFLNINQDLKRQIVELTEENHKEKNEIEKLNEIINLNEIEKENYLKEKNMLMDSLDSKDEQIENHINEKKELVTKNKILSENLELNVESVKRHEDLLNKLNQENDTLQDVLTNLKAELIDLEKENNGLGSENDDLRLKIQDMHSQLNDGSNERGNWNSKLSEMAKRLSKETEDKFDQIKENKKLLNEIKEVNMNLDKCMLKLNSVEDDNIKLNEKLQLSDIKCKQVINELSETQNKSKKIEVYASSLEKKMATMERELELWKSRYETKVRE